MNHAFLIRSCIATALITSILFLVFNVLRLAFIYNTAHAFLVLNMLTVAAIAFIGLCSWRRLTVTRLEWLLVGALAISVLAADYTGREPANILIDVARPLLFLAVVITLRSIVHTNVISTSFSIRRLFAACIWATVAGVMIGTFVNHFIKGIYPAYSSIDSVLGLGWLIALGGTSAPLLFLCILIFSGKRAVYLAAGFAMLLFYRRQPPMLRSIITLICLGFMFTAINVQHHGLATYEQITEYYSGGRLDEIRDAIAAVPNSENFITGMGPGFAYPSSFFASQAYLHRNVHFTPLSLIIYYGLIFSVLFAIYIARMLPAAWRALNDKTSPVGMSYAIYFFASLPFALTEYSIFAYANFAIACGLIMANQKKLPEACNVD